MKTSLFSILIAGVVMASCMAPVEKQYFSDSPDIDLAKKVTEAYLSQNWDAYPELFADTVRIWRNVNWETNEGFTLSEYIEDLQNGLQGVSSYSLENQVWESVVNDEGEHWVHIWFVWTGHNDLTNKDYEIPVHVSSLVEGGKITVQGEFFNGAEVALDMMALQMVAGEDEDHDEDEDDDDR